MRAEVYLDNGEFIGHVQVYGHPTTDDLIEETDEKFGKHQWSYIRINNENETYSGEADIAERKD